MSKLPNAPLLEVIFELRWNVTNQADLNKFQYLHGDLYSVLKTKYPTRETLAPAELPLEVLVGKPVHRFKDKINGYPLYQLGPGLLTINTTDDYYFWETFSKEIDEVLNNFFDVYPVSKGEEFQPSLTYFDFFKLNYEEVDCINFINQNLNISFQQSFFDNTENANTFNVNFSYPLDNGVLSIVLGTGSNNKGENGLILQTKVSGNFLKPDKQVIISWLLEAQKLSSSVFKKMTEGPLFDSFK